MGYVVTAFLVILITSSYYLFTYQPDLDPFRQSDDAGDQTAVSRYRSNPIDKVILQWVAKWLPRNPEEENASYSRVEEALIKVCARIGMRTGSLTVLKCVLNMSDLQIVTGLSILISGFTQLSCGLSAYHWQIVVYLAWFSSLTHLCCLTFLRNYLYNHPGQRLWRLASMFIIIIMLVVALFPTGYFNWNGDFYATPTPPSSYAICFYGRKPPRSSASSGSIVPNSYISMIISSLLLLLCFLTRVIRLHERLSIDFVQRLRAYLSATARRGLRWIYGKCRVHHETRILLRFLIYRPLLAGFLMLRVLLDVYSSMFMEVRNQIALVLPLS